MLFIIDTAKLHHLSIGSQFLQPCKMYFLHIEVSITLIFIA